MQPRVLAPAPATAERVLAPAPATAERVRTVLAATGSAAITRLDGDDTAVDVSVHDRDGRLLLRPMTPETLGPRVRAVAGPRQATVEVADVAPVPMRDRIRARVCIEGSVIRDETTTEVLWHCLPEQVLLHEDGGTRTATLSSLLNARPDPFAQVEGALLGHWDSAHPETLALLTRLVPAGRLHGVVRVRPLRLDRYGLALRLEYARGHRDTRVDFPAPVSTPEALSSAVRALLDRARRQHRRCRGRGNG